MIVARYSAIDGGRTAHKVARMWGGAILLGSGIRVRVRGASNLDPSRPCIYMSNHQSNFDIPVLVSCLKVQFRWLAKKELFRIPLFGHAMKQSGSISVDRSNRRAAFESLKQTAQTIKNGVSVVIFPEGTRSTDGYIRDFKKGGFVLAAEAGVPIVPVILHGTRAIMPKKQISITPGDVLMEIRSPIETSIYGRKDKNMLMEKVRAIVCESFEEGKIRN
ncbi:MAG: 1-acyl-sn-glycerol-3-phosphate acyltransferase [Desulfobacteraceae bacterium]|nr:1-acyl-sn-glycerol-3-phosphate acyltransferase [Desulfobacteraceae bacterium]